MQLIDFGDQFDAQTIQEIRDNANFENFTTITNMAYGTNMTSDEYKILLGKCSIHE